MFLKNRISKKYIKKELSESGFKISVKNSVSSTNTLMKERGKKGAGEFSVLIAQRQTKGRGRMGRSFYSPDGSGIYMSILLKPDINTNSLLITTHTAVCCARVFERMTGKSVGIKWVNDIYMNERKVCGILAESYVGEESFTVLGIGINVVKPKDGFPDDIKNRAGAVFESSSPYLREKLICELLREFIKMYKEKNNKEYLKEYKERSIITGKEILLLKSETEEKATALYINDDYSLTVEKENGEICTVNSGDVSIKI